MHIAALLITAVFAQATATTGPAESVTTGSAVVTGTVDSAATYYFEYGTTGNYGLRTPDVTANAAGEARQTLTGLTNGTTYHYRVVSGGAQGADRTFTTASPPRAPSISSQTPTGVIATGANLRARVNPRGLATTVQFQYGTTTSYGATTPVQSIGAGTSTVNVAAAIGSLAPNTVYHYRAVATSAAGVTRGGDRSFRTSRAPTGVAITPSTIRPVWGSGLTITGTVSGVNATPVALQRQNFPYTTPFATIATATTNNSGAFTFTVPALFTTTRLRVLTQTAIVATSPATTASVAVKVGLRSRRLSGRRYRLEGSIWPAVPAGRVSLQRQSRSGRWSPVARTATSPLSGDRSRYRFTVRRTRTARNYRIVVVPNDGGFHVSGHSRIVTLPRR